MVVSVMCLRVENKFLSTKMFILRTQIDMWNIDICMLLFFASKLLLGICFDGLSLFDFQERNLHFLNQFTVACILLRSYIDYITSANAK